MVRALQRLRGWLVAATVILGWLVLLPHGDPRSGGLSTSPTAGGDARSKPPDEEIDPFLAAGDDHLDLGEFQKALAAYELAAVTAREKNRRDLLAASLSGQGLAHKRRGDYFLAVTLYSQALALCRELGDSYCEAELLHNLGTCYTNLGELQVAKDALNDALETWSSPWGRSITLTAIATIHDLEGEHETAIEQLRRAFALRHADPEVEAETRLRGKATTLDRLATALKAVGRMEDARRAYEASLSIWQKVGPSASVAVVSDNLGWLYVDWQQPEAARRHLERALSLFEHHERPHEVAHTLMGLAHAHHQLGDLVTASAAVKEAIEIIESLRSTSYSQLLRTSFLAARQPYYELYIDILMQRHEAQPSAGFDSSALQAAERFKARSLLDLLHEERAALRQGTDEELLQLEERLHREMSVKDRERLELLHAGSPTEEIARVEKERRGLILRYEDLRAQARAEVGAAPPLPITPGQMQGFLDDDTLLLVYALGEERSFLWSVSREEITPFRLPGRETIESLARKTYDWLQRSDQRDARGEGREAAGRLSEMLLSPLGKALNDQRLVVVADGWLHYIPFAALAFSDSRPLNLDHEIVMLPSASVLAALRRRAADREPAPKRLAVVADPVFGLDDPRRGAATKDGARGNSRMPVPDRLEHSAKEAASILELVTPEERFGALGFDASRRMVLGGDLDRYRIVHFAVHGEIDDQRPEYSHLVLSLLDRQGRPQDGRLYLHEIDGLRLPAELVVLSACNTALGKRVRGEGIVGLTRGFMYAGASSVVVSLWYVSDVATAELMARFYRELLVAGRTPAAALRAAQAWIRQTPRWQAPYFWAGFVLQGEWR